MGYFDVKWRNTLLLGSKFIFHIAVHQSFSEHAFEYLANGMFDWNTMFLYDILVIHTEQIRQLRQVREALNIGLGRPQELNEAYKMLVDQAHEQAKEDVSKITYTYRESFRRSAEFHEWSNTKLPLPDPNTPIPQSKDYLFPQERWGGHPRKHF